MQSHLLDPVFDAPSAEEALEALDAQYDVVPSYEALEALRVAPPTQEPVRLTRQAARRLAIQMLDASLKSEGYPRRERRRMIFWRSESGPRLFRLSDLARALAAGQPSTAAPTSPA
jgi:hypothetical protein